MLEFPFFRALYKMDIAHVRHTHSRHASATTRSRMLTAQILRFVRVYELLFSQQLPVGFPSSFKIS
jgi:ribulose-5-phosphate 4-epimerase/fuculose-1-phosphate aldolase